MKKLIELKLKFLARLVLAKYKPKIIGITGSVGKTSTKFMVGSVLRAKYRVRWAERNYNNELGLPLAVLNEQAQGKNLFAWFGVFWRAGLLLIFKNKDFPEIIILEMGVDRPGDMDYLLSIAQPKLGVITNISESHLEHFASMEKLKEEKGKLAVALPSDGTLIVNFDNEEAREQVGKAKGKVISFGLNDGADIQAINLSLQYEGDKFLGTKFEIKYQKEIFSVIQPGILGFNHIYSDLVAVAIGLEFCMKRAKIAEALKYPELPRGRMRLIAGIKYTTLIDDTYNASPQSSLSALGMLKRLKVREGARRIVVLADMLELGSYSVVGHKQVGKYCQKIGVDYLYTIGEKAQDIKRGAMEAGMSEDKIYSFDDNQTAGQFLQDRIKQGDVILIKGSRGMQTEQIVKEIMADPLRAEELLILKKP